MEGRGGVFRLLFVMTGDPKGDGSRVFSTFPRPSSSGWGKGTRAEVEDTSRGVC